MEENSYAWLYMFFITHWLIPVTNTNFKKSSSENPFLIFASELQENLEEMFHRYYIHTIVRHEEVNLFVAYNRTILYLNMLNTMHVVPRKHFFKICFLVTDNGVWIVNKRLYRICHHNCPSLKDCTITSQRLFFIYFLTIGDIYFKISLKVPRG